MGSIIITNKKLSYRRQTARQLHPSFSAHSLIAHFTEHRISNGDLLAKNR